MNALNQHAPSQAANRAVSARNQAELRTPSLVPPVDVVESAAGITLWADLPGVNKEGLDIRVQDSQLHIEAQAKLPTPANLRIQHAEIRESRFRRVFSVSNDFDLSRIEAVLKDGVLQLAIPRREEAKPRKIEVQVG